MKILTAALATAAALSLAAGAGATNLVQNGDFATLTNGPGQLTNNTVATDWSVPTGGFTFVFAPGTADTTGSEGQYGALKLWGPNDGSANGLPAASPIGGNFAAMDGDFQRKPLEQTITGLTIGKTYAVTFWDAFGQQQGFNGATVQSLSVNLGGTFNGSGFTGGETQTTADVDVASHGFSGWVQQTFDFTATGPSETLSFLANGNLPVPPFALIDGVSMSAVPEPADWALMLLGVGGIGAMARARRAATPHLSAA